MASTASRRLGQPIVYEARCRPWHVLRRSGGRPRGSAAPRAAFGAPRPVALPPDYKQRVVRQFEGRAEGYDAAASRYHLPLAERLVQLAALAPGEAVLDVATGTGLAALLAAEAVGRRGRVLGVDLSPAMIRQAEAKAHAAPAPGGISFLVGDIDECDFAAGSFDAVLCSSALPFLPDIPAALARWRRWLRPGGRVAFNVPKGVGSQTFSVFAAAAADKGLLLADPSTAFADEGAVRALLGSAGYLRASLETSAETNFRPCASPREWAAAAWRQCRAMPFADLPALLPADEVEDMERQFLQAAAALAEGWAVPGGVAEPYAMLWVLAHA